MLFFIFLRKILFKLFLALGMLSLAAYSYAQERVLNIYNWSDFIAPDTIKNFEKESGIKVNYDMFDSNEILESKLMAGNTGFDLVIPTSNFIARQIDIGIYQALDKSKIPNWANLDEHFLSLVANHDPDNKHSFPYLWSTTGIGYNVDKVKAIFGDDVKLDSWDMMFKVENAQKLSQCGLVWVNDPTEIFASVLHYLGHDPNTSDEKAYREAFDLLREIRPYVKYIHSSSFISDLANGDICAVIGWGGDILQAADRAEEANNGNSIDYFIPQEGAVIFFDVFAIPSDAKNVDEAHEFLNYIARPEVSANIANYVFYGNPNKSAIPYLSQELLAHQGINPSPELRNKLFALKVQSPKLERTLTRLWTEIVTGK